MFEFKTLLYIAPQNENNYLEHFVGALYLDEDFLSRKLKDLNCACSNLEICLILKKIEAKHENFLLQIVVSCSQG